MEKRTYLIQKLIIPTEEGKRRRAFGAGGLGGFNPEAYAEITDIWNFYYMGSAHFEFGEVPRALQKIIEYSSLGKAQTDKIQIKNNQYTTSAKKG